MNIQKYNSKIEATQKARQELLSQLESNKSKPILLMLSGRSCLELLGDFDGSVLGSHVCVTMLDERFSNEEGVNNWLQIKETDFYKNAVEAGCQFIETVPKAQESLERFTKRWEKDLQKWIKKNPHRTIVATVGIGADGHIAGINPFTKNPEKFLDFYFTSDWVKGYKGELEPPKRVTVTARFMEDKIDHAIVYVVGEAKRDALNNLLIEEGRMADTPARILREMKNVEIFTNL